MKKSVLIFLVFLLLLSLNGVFAQENNKKNSESNNIYVSNYGSDSLGNGSQSNPYQTLGYGIYKASNNSNIYLEEGIYNSTGYVIHNSLTISGINNVTINGLNGQNDQYIFDITNQGSLVLNNLNFINGYADLYGSESCFVNRGFLCVNNSNFNNFSTFMGAIKNYNSLEITNVTTSNLKYSLKGQYGEFVTNLNNCTITNSNINNIIYNNKKITVNNSYIKEFVANKDYDENIVTNYINKTEIGLMKCSYCDSLIIKNTIINFTTQVMVYSPDGYIIQYVDYSIDYSNVFADNCSFIYKIRSVGGSSVLSKFSNLTVISSYFNKNISVIGSNVNISYSTILGYIFSETDSSVNASFNWWGKNSGPTVYSLGLSNCTADYWVVMTFTCDESPIPVGTNSKFTASLNHYTNGGRVWDLKNASLLNQRSVKFQVENGNFSPSYGYLTNSTFSTFLFNNTEPVMVYAIVDKQLLRLPLGTGYTTYEWYVSNSHGHDFYGDGSYENPFKTISRAVSASLTGNKIYLFPDIYTLSWNSNLKISKNLTFFGIGNVTISRPNNRNIFIVDEKGSLTIEHINFTAIRLDYYNPIIVLNGGTLFVRDSNFYNIKTCSVIQLDSLDEVKIDNCTFKNIGGSIVRGNASMVYIYNSYFEHCSYFYCGDYDFAYCIAIKSNLYMVNATFNNNSQGSVNLNPRMFFNTYLNASIYNSTFSNNNLNFLNNIAIPDVSLGVPEWNPHIYGIIENCLFNNTKGQVASCSIINNSRFINNVATQFSEEYHHTIVYPLDLVRADLINNSYFYNNSYVSKTYKTKLITANNVYHSSFIKNKAAYGGALADPKEVHYCVFVNNSATYGGDDIFVYKGNLNCSYNWWGSNQKPNNTRVNVFLGSLTLDNWVIMSLSNNHNVITASLTSILDNNENIHIFNGILPSRIVIFSTDYGKINPQNVSLINNRGSAYLIKDGISDDFNVYGTIDNQKLSLTVYNNSTQLLMGNILFFGNQNRYNVTLINVNGHRIFNQTLTVFVIDSNGKIESFNILTDDKGNAGFDVNYPVGFYTVEVYYNGNGYFEFCNNSASINISSISTNLVSLNYTYYGKNNRFYVLLKDNSGKYLLNQTLTLTIYDSKGQVSKNNLKTSNGGRAEALLTLDCGEYKLEWNYSGNEWYGASYCESFIVVRPVNSTLILPNITFYGKGNMYNITLKDSFGTLIKGETITLIISKDNVSSEFKLKTDNYGNASITINLLPGVYKLESYYLGDEIYGEASNQGILTVLPIYTTLNFNSHVVIPENGVFTVVILDMYGRRVSGENISLELYKNGFYKIYYGISDANGEVNFRIDAVENIYFAIINYYGNIWYRESTGAATIVVSHEAVLNNIYISANDFVQYYGENKYFVISFNDSNAYSLYGKTISVSISSIDWHQSYNIISDVFGKARLQITLEPGVYNITYKYTNSYYGMFGQNSSSIVVYPMPTYVFANDVVMNIGEARYFEIRLSDVNNKGISNLPVKINVNGKSYNRTTNQKGICKFVFNLDVGKYNITYSFDNPNYVGSKGYSTVFVVDSQKTSTKLTGNDINVLNGESINYTLCLTNILGNPISASEVVLKITDFEKKIIGTYKAFSDNNGKANFNLNLTYGDYIANSYYAGNDNYLFSYSTNFIHVNPLDNMVQTVLFGRDCNLVMGMVINIM